ncbi:MAG: RNA-guided endonuclease TnpB family protein [Clostridiales bacterium]|nr:RNA-guided endonuclease TnpB family protein [Clostridiales bacterium]
MAKRARFHQVRAELQSKGTKSAKRALKRISGRENRWMTDVNHQKSKAFVLKYGAGTLFVIEDLAGVSFSEELLNRRNAKGRNELRSWAFYQFEQFLSYKAQAAGSAVVKVDAAYTSQRYPKCGRIRKANRSHEKHEYRCDVCHYRSNDDRVGAMNIYELGRRYAAGEPDPGFKRR